MTSRGVALENTSSPIEGERDASALGLCGELVEVARPVSDAQLSGR